MAVGAEFSENLHVFEVSRGESLHLGKGCLEVGGKAVDHLGSPTFPALAFKNIAPDVVIEANLLGIGRKQGSLSRTLNALFEASEPVGVVGGPWKCGFFVHALCSS